MQITDGRGNTLESPYTNEEAAQLLVERVPADSWLWYHVHKLVGPKSSDKSSRFLADSFMVALGYGLKRPMIRLHYLIQRFKVYLSRRGTLCLKSGLLTTGARILESKDPEGAEQYVGCWFGGRFLPKDGRKPTPTEQLFLRRLDEDPVGFMAQCSKDMGRCCYCNSPLDDSRSLANGYGPVCARRWALPWGNPTDSRRVASFAEQYDRDAAGLLDAVRHDPTDAGTWGAFGDWLEEHGLPRCSTPADSVLVPRV